MRDDKKQHNDNKSQKHFRKVGKGAIIGFTGNIFHLSITFVTYALVTRYISREEFGYLSLALAFINILSATCCLGIDKGFPGYVAKYRQTNEPAIIDKAINTSFILIGLLSLSCALILPFCASSIAHLWNKPGMAQPIAIVAIAIPFIGLSTMLTVYLQSSENVLGKFYKEVSTAVIRLLFITAAILLSLSFSTILWAHTVTFIIVFSLLLFYAKKKSVGTFSTKFSLITAGTLVNHSYPLFISGMVAVLLMWGDTIILGYFSSADEVGMYNAGLRLSRLLRLSYLSTGFIFLPIAARLFFKKELKQLDFLYYFSTKWMVIFTMPFFCFFILAPEETIGLFFGSKYIVEDYLFFQLLCIGAFVNAIVGLSEMSLIAFNLNKKILFCAVIAGTSNIILNFLFIPLWGKTGAALASLCAMVIVNGLTTYFNYKHTRIQPFKEDYVKVLIGVITGLILLLLFQKFSATQLSIWMLFSFSFLGIPFIVIITRSISREDIKFLEFIEMKTIKRNLLSEKLLRLSGIKYK